MSLEGQVKWGENSRDDMIRDEEQERGMLWLSKAGTKYLRKAVSGVRA